MTSTEYLKELEQRIRKLSVRDKAEILADYREHFDAGKQAGKSEDEISTSLGTPKSVAQSILMNTLVTEAETAPTVLKGSQALLRILLMVLILAPFNFFMLACPFLVMFALICVGWSIPLAMAALVFGGWGIYLNADGPGLGLMHTLSAFCMAVGTLGLAVMAALIMGLITSGALQLLLSYFKWNVRLIKSRQGELT